MRVAMLAEPDYPVPPFAGYGGTQRGVYDLAGYLAQRDHDVHVLAAADSNIDIPGVNLVATHEISLASDPELVGNLGTYAVAFDQWKATVVDTLEELTRANEIDVVNLRCHQPDILDRVRHFSPVVQSVGSSLAVNAMREFLLPDVAITAHTEAHKQALGDFDQIQVLPYGIDTSRLPDATKPLSQSDQVPVLDVLKKLQDRGQDYLLHLATIERRKGQKTSIEIARKAGIPIIIAGTPNTLPGRSASRDYFAQEIEPLFDGENVIYFGNANETEKYELMRFARATLFSSGIEDSSFKEPFGRVIAESLACGAPVIGCQLGSFPELVPEGEAGFGFDTVGQAVEAVRRLDEISRTNCVEFAKRELSVEKFGSGMEKLLAEAIQRAA